MFSSIWQSFLVLMVLLAPAHFPSPVAIICIMTHNPLKAQQWLFWNKYHRIAEVERDQRDHRVQPPRYLKDYLRGFPQCKLFQEKTKQDKMRKKQGTKDHTMCVHIPLHYIKGARGLGGKSSACSFSAGILLKAWREQNMKQKSRHAVLECAHESPATPSSEGEVGSELRQVSSATSSLGCRCLLSAQRHWHPPGSQDGSLETCSLHPTSALAPVQATRVESTRKSKSEVAEGWAAGRLLPINRRGG